MLGLMTHCGAAHVSRDELAKVTLPAQTDTHTPIAHDYFADLVEDRLNEAGLRVINNAFALQRKGSDMFGLMEIGTDGGEFTSVVGLRNSHGKRLSAGLVMGRGVFVCDNLMFEGEVKFGRRHTLNILNDLPDMVTDAISKIMLVKDVQDARAEAYKTAQLGSADADHLIVNMLREGVINTQRVEKVVAEWDAPSHEEFKRTGRSVWRLEQATTEALKGANVIQLPDRTQKLRDILDEAAEFDAPVLAEAA